MHVPMSSRVHQIRLSESLEQRLHDRAEAAGTDPDTFIVQTLEARLQAPKSFKELFAPLQEAFAGSGDSPEEVERTLGQLRDSVFQSRRARAS